MTFMSFLLLIVLFLSGFVYFSGLNPQAVTIYFSPGDGATYPLAVIVVGSILVGLLLGFLVHLYSTVGHMIKHWKRDRLERRNREVTAIYREGVSRLLSGDIKKARILLQRALDRDAGRIEIHLAMANVFIQDGDAQEAVAILTKARNLDGKSLEVLFKLASVNEELGRLDEAKQAYQTILLLEDGNRKALRGLRDLRVRGNEWKDALELQKRILKGSTDSKRLPDEKQKMLYIRYEVAREELGEGGKKLDAAKEELKEIVKEAADFVPARVSLGDAYRLLGRPDDAVRVWEEGYRDLGRGVFLSRMEDLFMAEEDPATLVDFYRAAIAERNNDMMLRFFFGKYCLRLEMVEEALEQLYVVESSGVESPQLYVLLAEAYRRRDRETEAIAQYQKALGINNQLRFDYLCDSCGEEVAEWQSRCPSCGSWGSFSVAGRKSLREARLAIELREIHHGEREAWRQE